MYIYIKLRRLGVVIISCTKRGPTSHHPLRSPAGHRDTDCIGSIGDYHPKLKEKHGKTNG